MTVAKKVRDALFAARTDLAAIQDRIADLRAKREAVEILPRDRASVERLVDEAIAGEVSPFSSSALASPLIDGFASAAQLRHQINADLFASLAAFDPKRLKSLILADAPDGLPDHERAAQIGKLDRDILAAEMAEELALREIDEASGTVALRRPDAPIEIILAPTSELQ